MNTEKFDYINHYKIDAEEFDYFEERTGATEDDEKRVHEFIISTVNQKTKSILDVGCGSAWVAGYFTKKGVSVISFDISDKNVKKAVQEVVSDHHFATVGDSFKLPFKDNSIDSVIASEVIEHVINPAEFVNELFRVVKPGGSLIVTTPYKEKLRYYLCIHCNKKTPLHAHIHSFDEKRLFSLITSANLKTTDWKTFGNKLLIFGRTYIVLKYFPFKLWKIIDSIFNMIYNVPVHIIVEYKKLS
jgi:2-polyprenyl-3-methyl-5-hydroxy-6-metoxy-1,4-benzoquinol methylase